MKEMNKYNLIKIEIMCFISTLILVFVNNLDIDNWLKLWFIPISIILINHIYIIKDNKLDINKKGYIFLLPIILMLISVLIVKIDDSNLTILVILPIVISMFFNSITNKNYIISLRTMSWFFKLIPLGFIENFMYLKLPKAKNNNMSSNIAKGCVIGIPVAGTLLLLLSCADKYFETFVNSLFEKIFSIFEFDFLIDKIGMPFIIFFVIIFATIINIIKNKDEKVKEKKLNNIDNVVTSTILIIINSVFILFLISEISKITTNFLNVPIEYTYAKYAREGFFELLAVTSINFGIIIYYLYNTTIIKENKKIKNLLFALICFSILLIFNNYYRMFLYINAYGFTILRLQVMLFLTMELILFLIFIKKIISDIKFNEGIIFTIIILTTYILNLYLCNQNFIDIINSL